MDDTTTQSDYLELCQRIRDKCRRQRWYGGDEENTARFHKSSLRFEVSYTPDGEKTVIDRDPDDHPRKTNFAYPPATEQQLAQTEEALGFYLPPLLRTLYMHVANGGFGPGYGLMGAIGGFGDAGDIVGNYLFYAKRAELIDLDNYEASILAGETLELPEAMWPRALLLFCDWGWAAASCVDSLTGRVFLMRPGNQKLHYRLELQTQSLEDWWELWLQDLLRFERDPLPGEEKLPDLVKNLKSLLKLPQYKQIRQLFETKIESFTTYAEESE